jgi:multidrug efflux system membrane fusion protein
MSKTKKYALLFSTIAVIAVSGATFAVHEFSPASAQPAAAAAPPAVPVSVRTLEPQNLRVWSEFSGRLAAVDFAEVRPEVSGRITEVRFRDGHMVKAGDVLFVIDPRPYEAALAKAEANLASARNNADYAQLEFDRAAMLIKSQAIAQRIYDERSNSKRVADAAVLAAEAELKQARVDIDHAYVKAPISGRLSRAEITLGNLVQSGQNAPVLTSVVSNDGIYADFDVDEQTYLQNVHPDANSQDKENKIPVEMTVQGDSESVYRGTIYTFDNRINTTTGTIRARAKFDNKDGKLVPGMFISVKLGSGSKGDLLVIPDRAVGSDQNKKFVFVVSEDNKVAYREVALGRNVGGQRIVLTGLKPGERVIVDGIQHVQPDAKVDPKEDVPDSKASAGK